MKPSVLYAGLAMGVWAVSGSVACWDGAQAFSRAADTSGSSSTVWVRGPDLPRPVANNAVAGHSLDGRTEVYSFLGIDTSKVWSGVQSWAFRWRLNEDEWSLLPPVPGPGRLAATAQAVGGRVFVFGGYTVDADGGEVSIESVDIFDPALERWSSGAPIPIPVDDAVSGVWRDSLIYLVSGWHNDGNEPDVQIYDPWTDTWSQASPIPGPPVFGHTGGLAGDHLVYVDGAEVVVGRPRYRLAQSSWRGTIDPAQPEHVEWSPLVPHPGPALYRAAALGVEEGVLFYGGTDNPYNYNGLGYDGAPAGARTHGFFYRVESASWEALPPLPVASMDHRGLALARDRVVLVGGMNSAREVSARVWSAPIASLLPR